MKKNKSKTGNTTVRFDDMIYPLRAIEKAVEGYKDLASFGVDKKEDHIEVVIKDINREVEKSFIDEFCNYVLAETKKIKSSH